MGLHFADRGKFARRPRLRDLRVGALWMGPEAAYATYTDVAGSCGLCEYLGDSSIQGSRSRVAARECINWKGLWVFEESLSQWYSRVTRKLVLVRMGSAAAVADANHGAGRSRQSTTLARGIKEYGVCFG